MMNARVFVTLKNGVLDPQGKAIEGALGSLGFDSVDAVRQGKIFDLKIDASSKEEAETQIAKMCEKLLANTVIENYSIELRD
ncbi:phosphoribosylformylglycinamidine synthase subunit PurS [Maritalea sp.]|uniref:phosphoribosylformylglycinamidine synthase subunit PurS n=1 Tax=Maritalea sp. TaxID=2003361 RepID=UPI0039E35BB7